MKILIVNKFLFPNGGSETYIFEIGRQLQKMGHQVQYFGMDHPKRIVGNEWNCYTDNMDFHSNKLSKLAYPFKIIYSREAYRKIMYVLEKFDPNIVHINNFNFQLTPSILYAIKKYGKKKKRELPIVMTAHDSQLVCPNHLMMIPSTGDICFACKGGKFWKCVKNRCIHNSLAKSILAALEGYLYRWLNSYRYIDLLICPSDFLREKMATNPVLAKRAVTLHNFIETENFERAVNKKDYILYFGRYSSEKGVKTLLEVCKRLPNIPFVFAGAGLLKEEIDKIENITEKGFLSGEELYRTIAEAQLVVFPSECNENCPFSVMEAQMCGTPVLGSDLGGIPELIEERVTGQLLEAGNVQLWVKTIQKLWGDKAQIEIYANNCKKVFFCTVKEYCAILIDKMQKLF